MVVYALDLEGARVGSLVIGMAAEAEAALEIETRVKKAPVPPWEEQIFLLLSVFRGVRCHRPLLRGGRLFSRLGRSWCHLASN